jgi:hypothetical protein
MQNPYIKKLLARNNNLYSKNENMNINRNFLWVNDCLYELQLLHWKYVK